LVAEKRDRPTGKSETRDDVGFLYMEAAIRIGWEWSSTIVCRKKEEGPYRMD
jgi:hypothetical protein